MSGYQNIDRDIQTQNNQLREWLSVNGPTIFRATARSADVAAAGSFVLMRSAPLFGPLAPETLAAGSLGVIVFSGIAVGADFMLDPSVEGAMMDGLIHSTIDRVFIGPQGEVIGLGVGAAYDELTR